jgi:hypothetical protein
MPISKNEEDMAGEGWYKEITIKKVKPLNGVVYVEEWDFFADSIPCLTREGGSGPPCGTQHVYMKCQNGKLLWCCHRHKVAQGPLTFEVGSKATEYIVSPLEAIDICSSTGQDIPEELKAMAATENSRTSFRRRPTKSVG